MIKVVIADHHPLTRLGIKKHLQSGKGSFSVVGEVAHGDELLTLLKKKKPKVLILELDMPGVHGFSLLKDIKQDFDDLQIIIFSSFPEAIYAHHCIDSGACGYIPKTTSTKDFLKIVKLILSGKKYLNGKIQKSTGGKARRSKQSFGKLSSRETEVLNLLLEGKRNKDIALRLDINEKTVSTYKSRLLKKMGIQNLADLINHTNALAHKP